MTKHSKNNTASSIFSYAEYKKLDYGTKRQRLGNESMRRFDCCALCLQRVREPLACQEGHLFCKECVYTDLLSQKKDIKRQKARLDALKREAEEEKARARAAARERVLLEFERGQLGLAATSAATTSGAETAETVGSKRKHPSSSSTPFTLDAAALAALAATAEEAALRRIEAEQADALRAKLPDFWLPSLTPTYAGGAGAPTSLDDVRLQTTCRGGEPVHPLSLKHLIPVKFTFAPAPATAATAALVDATPVADTKTPAQRDDELSAMCSPCKKELSNSTKMCLLKPCAHVVCKTCTDTLVRPAMQCVVCDAVLAKGDIIELRREGTGFAGGGLAETSKKGIAFQG